MQINLTCAFRYIGAGKIVDVTNPIGSIIIEEDEILPGEYTTYKYTLVEESKYHIYLNGLWTEDPDYKTDYDVYVYRYNNGRYNFISGYTESAGFPEQISNDGKGQYFIPDQTGDYYISVYNDVKESNSSKEAILTVIEHINTDVWIDARLEAGHASRDHPLNNWAFEYNTTSPELKVHIQVPNSLDMYETRLFLMGDPDIGKNPLGGYINGIPVAWSMGLKGEVRSGIGGFNFDPQGYRDPLLVDSAQWFGEDMEIKVKTNNHRNKLYHLLLMAEEGAGTVRFMVQTDFSPPEINLMNTTKIVDVKNRYYLDVEATSRYGIDTLSINYTLDNVTYVPDEKFKVEKGNLYRYLLPRLSPGETVSYEVEAVDNLGAASSRTGSLKVMSNSSIELKVLSNKITAGEEIIMFGSIINGNDEFQISYQKNGVTWEDTIIPRNDGTFIHRFTPNSAGTWTIKARFEGNNGYHPTVAEDLSCTVESQDTYITCETKRQRYRLGDEVEISGYYSFSAFAKEVIISVYHDGDVDHLLALTDRDGRYTAVFQPEEVGEYTIRTSIKGDGFLFKEATSEAKPFTVDKPILPEYIRRHTGNISPSTTISLILGLSTSVMLGGVIYFRKR